MDLRLRALERSASTGDPEAHARLEAELERTGAIEAFDRDLEALLAEAQPDDPTDPTSSRLGASWLAEAIEAVASSPTTPWRVLIAEHHFRVLTASPVGTYAAVVREGDVVVLGVERGDTRLAANHLACLGPTSDLRVTLPR